MVAPPRKIPLSPVKHFLPIFIINLSVDAQNDNWRNEPLYSASIFLPTGLLKRVKKGLRSLGAWAVGLAACIQTYMCIYEPLIKNSKGNKKLGMPIP
jgi:hypothetical protein